MTKNEFRQFIDNGPIILDGATGTNLMDAGMPIGVCPEAWILEHKDVLLKLRGNMWRLEPISYMLLHLQETG